MILVDPGGARQVRWRAVNWNLSDVTPRRHQQRRTVRRKIVITAAERVFDSHRLTLFGLLQSARRAVFGQVGLQLAHALGGGVEAIETATLLERDPAGAERRPVHVEIVEMGDLVEAARMVWRKSGPRSEIK